MLHLYKTTDNINIINKNKTLIAEYDIKLRRDTNVLNPIIPIQDDTIDLIASNCNYAFIEEFQRYYFVKNIEPFPNNSYKLLMEIDVLETYKKEIKEAKMIEYKNQVDIDTTNLVSDVILPKEHSFLLLTQSGIIDETLTYKGSV